MGALAPAETVRALELLLPVRRTHPLTPNPTGRVRGTNRPGLSARANTVATPAPSAPLPPLPETLASLGPLQGRGAQPPESGRYVPPFLEWARGGEAGT